MAHSFRTVKAADDALAVHVKGVGNTNEPFETQVSDLIADLLLNLPDREAMARVAERALSDATEDAKESDV